MSEWFDQAACKGAGSNIFFPDIPTGDVRRLHWLPAKEYCDRCPVVQQCLEFVLPFEAQVNRRDGYWANMTPKEREQYVRLEERLRRK